MVKLKISEIKRRKKLKQVLYEEQQGYCAYCGKWMSPLEATLDHIYPYSKGGETKEDNCVVCCRSCNLTKGNKLLVEVFNIIKQPRCFVKLSPYIGLRIMK